MTHTVVRFDGGTPSDEEAVTVVCLVRHGETDWNRLGRLQGQRDIPLNAAGREQARHAGHALRADHWDALIASPLLRAWETALILADHLDVPPIEPDRRLMERNYGAAEGMLGAEARAAFPDDRIPGMESREALRERSMAALADVLAGRIGQRVIVVAHGGVINAILSVISDGAVGTGKTRLHNACLSVVTHESGRWQVRSHNGVDHLALGCPPT